MTLMHTFPKITALNKFSWRRIYLRSYVCSKHKHTSYSLALLLWQEACCSKFFHLSICCWFRSETLVNQLVNLPCVFIGFLPDVIFQNKPPLYYTRGYLERTQSKRLRYNKKVYVCCAQRLEVDCSEGVWINLQPMPRRGTHCDRTTVYETYTAR